MQRVCLALRSGRNMNAPNIADRVRVRGNEMPFFVTSIDEERRVVNLIPVTGLWPVLDEVPFSDLVSGPSTHPDSSER
jgi:hypothetical protein